MKTTQAALLLSIVCFLGCSSTHRLRPAHEEGYDSLNYRAVGKKAMVTFVDDRKIRVDNLRMTADSTYWIDPQSSTSIGVATSEIKEVRFIRGRKGAVEGMVVGIVGGLLLGVRFGVSHAEDACPRCTIPATEGDIIVLSTIGGIGIGAAVGAAIGAAVGHRDIYLVEHEGATDTN